MRVPIPDGIVLRSHKADYPYFQYDTWFNNIASNSKEESLEIIQHEIWPWSAVVRNANCVWVGCLLQNCENNFRITGVIVAS